MSKYATKSLYIMELEVVSQGMVIKTFGGTGGSEFAADYIQSIGLYCGKEVDSITINGNKHGGGGGGDAGALILSSDEYISKVVIRSGERIDKLMLTTNKGRTIGGGGGGGSETTLDNIRVVAIGGKSGTRVDQLKITYVENYEPSSLVEKRGQFVVGFTPQGTILKEYTESTSKTSDSYENVTETMLSQQYNASVEAEYYAKVAFSTEIKYVNTQLTTIKKELSTQLINQQSKEVTIEKGMVGVLLVDGAVMKGSDGVYWMYPNTLLSYAVIAVTDYQNILNHYDLTGELATQMPELLKYKTEKNDYVFYEKTPVR
ncbi:jacalin-like lectin [Flavobacterium cerinum]|uniref:Jacalin-type lectin domain-containing protein n=1 Tax=Flavobacterium cerinum TaxID=2502784 RepID=A0ABY5IXB4_9FLAO|nr:hypothetical protein [Flavobacterium cerinum]UUC46925.1 hypothetical protein NOX80_06925 [Flavobacterium cerinum]